MIPRNIKYFWGKKWIIQELEGVENIIVSWCQKIEHCVLKVVKLFELEKNKLIFYLLKFFM